MLYGSENRSLCGFESSSIITGDVRHPQYATLGERTKTFGTWKKPLVDANKLIDVGFIYTGKHDIVECFCCGEMLKDWDDASDPWREHAMVAPRCPHVRRCKGDEFIQKVHNETEITDDTVSMLGYPMVEIIRAAGDKDENAVSTFRVKKLMNESTTVEEILKILREKKNEAERNGETIASSGEDLEDEDKLIEENRTLKEKITCKICFKAMACIVTIPCGHMESCCQCIPALTTCVVCGTNIQGTVRAITAVRI